MSSMTFPVPTRAGDEVRGPDDSAIVGLPLRRLARLLRGAGLDP